VGVSRPAAGLEAWDLMANDHGWWKSALIAAVCLVCFYHVDLYDLRIVSDYRGLFVRSLQALGTTSLVLADLYY
jgi:hypothetical protein